MRLLFLEFDGVLHSSRAELDGKYFAWLPALEKLLATHPDVRIVVHSYWRYHHSDQELKEFLGSLCERFIGSTPQVEQEKSIETVLQTRQGQHSSYLVLDADLDEFTAGKLKVLFVDGILGLGAAMNQLGVATWLMQTAPVAERVE